ncbi:cytidine deaminase [Rhodanobacter sp. L36]|uniref:cytidine deaminase n=1 Tax=Rhodanobacter sp. L36 TaxID=1747221 RepID=UPI00131AE017|nr:cytidine deaminase [Rhodanobacter sp. L36]
MPVSATAFDEMIQLAHEARNRAYAPYSHFFVGAALLTHDGRRFTGCNVENASYGLCNCAERTTLFSAIAAGCQPGDFAAMAVIGDCPAPITPCGACRQVMAELCDADMPVLLANLRGEMQRTSVSELLPGSFRLPARA